MALEAHVFKVRDQIDPFGDRYYEPPEESPSKPPPGTILTNLEALATGQPRYFAFGQPRILHGEETDTYTIAFDPRSPMYLDQESRESQRRGPILMVIGENIGDRRVAQQAILDYFTSPPYRTGSPNDMADLDTKCPIDVFALFSEGKCAPGQDWEADGVLVYNGKYAFKPDLQHPLYDWIQVEDDTPPDTLPPRPPMPQPPPAPGIGGP